MCVVIQLVDRDCVGASLFKIRLENVSNFFYLLLYVCRKQRSDLEKYVTHLFRSMNTRTYLSEPKSSWLDGLMNFGFVRPYEILQINVDTGLFGNCIF